MAVSTYALQTGYRMGGVKPVIYLMRRAGTRLSYTVDDGTCHLHSVEADDIMKLEGDSATFTETASQGNRYGFQSTLTLVIHEASEEVWQLVLDAIARDEFYTVFEDNHGTQYIQSVEFAPDYSYSYTFNDTTNNAHQCTIRFRSEGNFPSMALTDALTPTAYPVYPRCGYVRGGVKGIRMCPTEFCAIRAYQGQQFDEVITYGGERFVSVEHLKGTFQFQQEYKDGIYSDRIQFAIPLADYRFYWHYGLEEFTANRYAVIFETTAGNTIATGFEFGFVPTYEIATGDGSQQLNTITFTLAHSGSESLLWSSFGEPAYIDDGGYSWARITDGVTDPVTGARLSSADCYEGEGIYTLVQMVTPSGQYLPKFMCLAGTESQYGNLDIVGTYTRDNFREFLDFGITFESQECRSQACEFTKTPPDIVFQAEGETRRFTVSAKCAWELTGLPSWITADVTSGLAGETVTVTFTTTEGPGQEEKRATLTWTNGDATIYSDVTMVKGVSWLVPTGFSIDAHGNQTLYSYPQGISPTDVAVTSVPDGVSTVRTAEGWAWTVMNANASEEQSVTYRIGVMNSLTGDTATVTIIQDHLYATWRKVEGDFLCDGVASYEKMRKFISYTDGGPETATDTYRKGGKIADRQEECVVKYSQWRDTGETGCAGSNLAKIQALWQSEDNENWEDTGHRRFGEIVEAGSPECDTDYKWERSGETVCEDGNLYDVLWKTYKGEPTGVTKRGDLVEAQSTECIDPSANYITWTLTNNGDGWFRPDPSHGQPNKPLFMFSSDGPVTVNYGGERVDKFNDGSYTDHEVSVNLNSAAGSSTNTTIMVTGPVTSLKLCGYITDGDNTLDLTAVNLRHAPYLREFYFNVNGKATQTVTEKNMRWEAFNIDLSECRSLKTFSVSNVTANVSAFHWPDHPQLQYLGLTNYELASGSTQNPFGTTSTTAANMKKIADGAPTVAGGFMEFCPLYTSSSDKTQQLACGVDFSVAEGNGWSVDSCCGGSHSVRVVENTGTECDMATHVKWNVGSIQEYDGSDWVDTGRTVRLSVAEENSEDCGYVDPVMTAWRQTTSYVCDGTTSHWVEEKWVSTDGGETWTQSIPLETRKGDVRAENDQVCGGDDPDIEWKYRWVDTTGTVCVGEDLYSRQKKQRSWDGINWEDVYPYEYQAGSLITEKSGECTGPITADTRWVNTDDTECDGYTLFRIQKKQRTTDGGLNWVDTGETRRGDVIEYNSAECGYGIEWREVEGEYMCVELTDDVLTSRKQANTSALRSEEDFQEVRRSAQGVYGDTRKGNH